MRSKLTIIVTLTLLIAPFYLFAQENTLVQMDDFRYDKITTAGFTLTSTQEISIEAVGITPYRLKSKTPYNDAWILNSQTRDVVWMLSDADDMDNSNNITTYEDQITLDAGKYEVFYSTYLNHYNEDRWNFGDERRGGFWNKVFGRAFYGDDWGINRSDYRELHININGVGEAASEDDISQWQNDRKESSIINYTAIRDDRFKEKIIKVTSPVKLKVYAIGEATREGEYDYGWITDLKTRKKIWELSYSESAYAGGAHKNRYSEEIIELDPGMYKVVYVTDDSHSFPRWNSAPPYDPAFWGLTLTLQEGDNSAISFTEMVEYEAENVIVNINRVRDDDYRSEGFTLKKELTLHIYALGEGASGDMFDYGWIVNTKTREKVWTMNYYDTDRAGGANKNRVFDGIITLEPGNYIAYYVSDGSHSYNRWNSGHPYNEKNWGMTVTISDDNFEKGDFAEYDESDDKSVLVRINRVGDYDRARAKFTLDDDQDVHVYAIGEGQSNEMYDYAWIENSKTGRVVWEMTYRKTERAGGARKNRLFDDRINLEEGEYEVFYETDDSHSFADWNDSPPHDPIHWGITITTIEK